MYFLRWNTAYIFTTFTKTLTLNFKEQHCSLNKIYFSRETFHTKYKCFLQDYADKKKTDFINTTIFMHPDSAYSTNNPICFSLFPSPSLYKQSKPLLSVDITLTICLFLKGVIFVSLFSLVVLVSILFFSV